MQSLESTARQPETLGSKIRRFSIGLLAVLAVLIGLLLASPDSAAKRANITFAEDETEAPSTDPFAPRTNRELDVLAFVKIALSVKDPKAAVPGFIGDPSRPLTSNATARDYLLDFDGFFAKAAQTQTLRPIFQAHRDRLARLAMVTGAMSSERFVPLPPRLKTLYCRRVGYATELGEGNRRTSNLLGHHKDGDECPCTGTDPRN